MIDYPDLGPDERDIAERFERDVLPYLKRQGPYIGEKAMGGDVLCEEIIRRAHLFVSGHPDMRVVNFRRLVADLKMYEAR